MDMSGAWAERRAFEAGEVLARVPWAQPSQVVASTALYSATAWPLTCTPYFMSGFWPAITRCWVFYPVDETASASGANNTSAVFKVGDLGAGDLTLATLKTYNGYTAGTVIETSMLVALQPKQIIYVDFILNGAGSRSYANASYPVCFGVDYVGERMA